MFSFSKLPFSRIKINKCNISLTVSAVLVICFLVYFMIHSLQGRSIMPQETEVANQDSKIKITANTDLIQKIVYLKCGDEEVLHTKPADNLVGMNYGQVQKAYPGWTIDKFDTLEVAMTLQVDSLCREHANNTFIGVKDGYVAVYYGKPGPKAILKEVTSIPVNKLMPQDLEELRRGMVVQSREELLRTLEGMQSR